LKILQVKNIVSGYGDIEVLKGVSINLEESEIIAIIGPNGAGKSTLMKSIFGLLRPKEGIIIFKGEEITGLKSNRIVNLGLGYVPQLNNVFPSLTVMENLEMGAFIEEDRNKIKSALENVYNLFPSLKERQDQRAGNLSGGEQQMLAIGKALMLSPDALLLDEPSAGLAPNLVKDIFEKIEDIRDTGTAVAVVEQNARMALKFADRGYVLDMGKNRFEGSGESLLKNEEVKKLYLGG
jgi:ABC-type branched-subunit amino acid transport system ATPase component